MGGFHSRPRTTKQEIHGSRINAAAIFKVTVMKFQVYDISGQPTGEEVEVSPAVFEAEPHEHAVALAVQAELTNRRQGTHSTKNRSMVRGGGRKPWRQKGRGVARAGTTRSPIWRGGGIIFGPRPHPYSMRLNKKVKRLARRSALSQKAREERIKIVTDFQWPEGKTANARNLLKAFAIGKEKALLMTSDYDSEIYRACKNIPDLDVIKAADASTYQIMRSGAVFIQKGALDSIQEVLNK